VFVCFYFVAECFDPSWLRKGTRKNAFFLGKKKALRHCYADPETSGGRPVAAWGLPLAPIALAIRKSRDRGDGLRELCNKGPRNGERRGCVVAVVGGSTAAGAFVTWKLQTRDRSNVCNFQADAASTLPKAVAMSCR
jgi:hypothetical protein